MSIVIYNLAKAFVELGTLFFPSLKAGAMESNHKNQPEGWDNVMDNRVAL